MTMNTPSLTSTEKKKLRGMAQRLKPILHIGKYGLTDSVQAEIETALTKNGLIKVRFDSDRERVNKLCVAIPKITGSELVGSIGKTAVFFRDMPEESADKTGV